MMSRISSLRDLGWDPASLAATEPLSNDAVPGRVVRAGRLLLVETDQGAVLATYIGDSTDRPVCGDWVETKLHRDSDRNALRGVVCSTLPRRNAIVRRAAGSRKPQAIVANVDRIWLVCGLDRDQGIRSLQRYQALTRLDGVQVVIVLNKADLCEDLPRELDRARSLAPGLEVLALSARARVGLEGLDSQLFPRETVALIGPSGVGKSSLCNVLAEVTHATTEVRDGDARGRHTTSAGELVRTRCGALLIDTPGLRELSLWQAQGLSQSYEDIFELARACRFRDCKHDREPGCQVKAALERRELLPERFLAFLELLRESEGEV